MLSGTKSTKLSLVGRREDMKGHNSIHPELDDEEDIGVPRTIMVYIIVLATSSFVLFSMVGVLGMVLQGWSYLFSFW